MMKQGQLWQVRRHAGARQTAVSASACRDQGNPGQQADGEKDL